MKKKILIIALTIIIVFTGVFLGSGFRKRTDVVLRDFSVSEDGSKITLHVAVSGSAGYIRDMKIKLGGDNKYLTFYPTFGLLNSKLGAKDEFELEVGSYCGSIYFYTGDGGYKEVLQKTETGDWKLAE